MLPLDKRPATPGRPVNSTVEALVARRRVKIRSKPTPLLRERFAPALHTTTTARSAAVPPPTRRPAAADPPPTRRRRPAATPRPPSSRDTLGPQCRQRHRRFARGLKRHRRTAHTARTAPAHAYPSPHGESAARGARRLGAQPSSSSELGRELISGRPGGAAIRLTVLVAMDEEAHAG